MVEGSLGWYLVTPTIVTLWRNLLFAAVFGSTRSLPPPAALNCVRSRLPPATLLFCHQDFCFRARIVAVVLVLLLLVTVVVGGGFVGGPVGGSVGGSAVGFRAYHQSHHQSHHQQLPPAATPAATTSISHQGHLQNLAQQRYAPGSGKRFFFYGEIRLGEYPHVVNFYARSVDNIPVGIGNPPGDQLRW